MTSPDQLLPPGFRFHPTDEELIVHYLKNRVAAVPCPASIITDVDIYKLDPWELPAKAAFGDKEWYFFTPRDRKYPNGVRPNRAAGSGYWKATGTDKPIVTSRLGKNENIGVKKALVFYKGKPPKGRKTNWIMHEYRLADMSNSNSNIHLRYSPLMKHKEASMRLDDWVLCRIYEKSNGHAGAPAADDQFEVDSSLASFSDLGNLHNRMQLSGDLFADADYHVLSRVLLHSNPQDLAGQEQLLSHLNINPTMNQPRFDGGNCANSTIFPFPGAPQLEPSVSMTSVGGGLKRQRVEDGSHEEHESYSLKSISSFMNSIDTPQLNAMNQSFFMSSHYGFQ